MARDLINSSKTTGFFTRRLDLLRIGKEDVVGCCQLPGSFGCATHCYFFFRKLIDVIEVKKVLKGLRSPLFGVHG
ncbi:hypothetical protein B9Z55_014309 [Caenorhabditis nigoni]|uniref:Uncharacterized protein n=1 Tax=Caenorhabditis nigoni TaxID=1611254 RepID=A0A2G5U5D7_9PELO|nr:hypothetical protein B9Z55_014309 [Caenorhabditis nigoni]